MAVLLALTFAYAADNPYDRAVAAAAREYGVPRDLIVAIGWEATHLNPDTVSTAWGGWGMYDLRDGDRDPSIDNAGALLSVDPNLLAKDWRMGTRGVAALLADHGRRSHGGTLPPADDLPAWSDAVKAFSGREEVHLQNLYSTYIFELMQTGLDADTRWGKVTIAPHAFEMPYVEPPPPPSSVDSPYADQFVDASSENYSDYSRGSGDIDMVVVHTVQGSYSSCYNWFANPDAEASAHYVVRSSDGQVTQMVKEADVAWHAGNWDYNERSVGIEHEGYVDDCSYYTDALYVGSAQLTADIAARQGISLDRSHIIGHDEVPDPDGSGWGGSGHHTDPGSCWDWDYYMELLGGGSGSSGGEIIGVVADTDIYSGTRLVGATVWIAETGETTTVASDGYYRFEDVPWGSYTMHATYPGYAEGTCSKTTSSSQDWCSIALLPDSGGGQDTAVDSGGGGEDTAVEDSPPDDTGIVDPPDAKGDAAGPGSMTGLDTIEAPGCGCVSGGRSVAGLSAAALAGLLVRRRRR